ncbi:hypothetical protein, partial [Pseudomonas kulmbachensis]|uniref:hypothetical protein n=1 Tax=Pseudomonas kulmbachensis TaxID=3043408 RepID=UPI0037548742
MDNTEFLYSRTIIFIQLLMPFCSLDEMFVGAGGGGGGGGEKNCGGGARRRPHTKKSEFKKKGRA